MLTERSVNIQHLTVGAVDAGVLVVTEEEALGALALVAAHGVDTHLLASTVVVHTLVYVYEEEETDEMYRRSHIKPDLRFCGGMFPMA